MKTNDLILNALTDAVSSQVRLVSLPVISGQARLDDILDCLSDISRNNDISIRIDGRTLLNNIIRGK